MKNKPNQTDQQQAQSWWNSLPGGKKRYLKEHSKLGTPEKITRYWLANIKAPEQFVSMPRQAGKSTVMKYNQSLPKELISRSPTLIMFDDLVQMYESNNHGNN